MRTRDIVSFPISNPKSLIPSFANGLVAALLAPACAACDALLDEPLSGCVCRNCWAAVRLITPPLCDGCGDPLPRPSGLCPECSCRKRIVVRARAAGEYDGTLREVIHALKYGKRCSLAAPLADLMRSRGTELLEQADYIVPVPLHWRRAYRRGFNQARELARHLGLPTVDALVRIRNTRAQVELAAERRRANMQAAFGLRRQGFRASPSIAGSKVLLVDDVRTTGATLEACAEVLKDAGAAEIYALTAARVSTRR
jgi:ComF family protein